MHRHLRLSALSLLTTVGLMLGSELAAQQLSDDILGKVHYRSIGPTRQGGRYVDFAVPLQDINTMYAATGSGGLWKSVNAGISWEPIFDDQSVISIGDVSVAPSDPNIVWVGTGEANNSRSTYWGDGVYKSTDAGATWTNMGLPESHHIGGIVIHATNPNIVYVAVLGHLYSENEERGLYKTTNGGGRWSKVLDIEDHGKQMGVVDVVMDPRNPDVLYAATYDKVRRPWTFNQGGPGSRIYKTSDGGRNWSKLEGGLPGGMLGRIGLSIAPSRSNTIYATIEDANSADVPEDERYQELLDGRPPRVRPNNDGVWRSDDAGATWRRTSPDSIHVGGGPPYYYGKIIVDPNDTDHVYVLSSRMYETTDGGTEWDRPFNFGGDNHVLWIDPDNSKHMMLGYDHGMGITYDGGENWYHPDNIPLAQFYAIGLDMDFPYNVYGGLQDNGSVKGPSTSRGGSIVFEDWERVGGGDGMYNVVDPNDSRWVYNESQFGPLSRLDQATGERRSIRYTGTDGLRWNWNAPILISPHDSKVVYHASNMLLKSTYRGENWEVISPDLTNADSAKIVGIGNIQYATITTVDESPIVPGVLWVGTDDGNVQVTRDGGENWTKLNDRIRGNPEYWVSRVEASNHFPGTAYVSYTGYRRDDFRPFLYKTEDYGETWTSIANNLPDEPINVIREDHRNPNLLFVGTELAVYVSVDGGNVWNKMKGDMPTQPVHDLKIHPRENDLVVGTHGRGIFITDITWLQELTPEVLASDVHLFQPEYKVRWVNNNRRVSSSANYRGESEPNGIVINYLLKGEAFEAPTIEIYQGVRMIAEIEGSNDAGLNSAVWDMTTRRERTEAEREEAQERGRRGRGGGGFGGFGRGGAGANRDPRFVYTPAAAATYTVVLKVDGKEYRSAATIVNDHWYR
ncbi:MAG: hypothetical protein IH798_00225 [Gemmatimonadetes bacterium]|nr:hypothetical protein [Gemmatimonadota bacterium]